ncbi:hypothetical protein CASFOL_018002 [Castilleja foliolosa]|uniref:Uncharacterized protein n=1 Tax=Castilleja foliolosa TaxID=1961234 RepID=A0ABD3DBI1_9LAMI
MESMFTELEMGAVLQLIQLSGGCADDFPVVWVNFPAKKEETNKESAGETSTLIDSENSSTIDDVLPRGKRQRRFGSLVDIYRKTQPSIKNRAKKKRARF